MKNKKVYTEDDYCYSGALEACGAKVLAFQRFGSWQGDWIAKIKYEGKIVYVSGAFGSCSWCDSFQGEFGYGDYYEDPNNKNNILKLKAFGMRYLDDLKSYDEILVEASKDIEWDSDAEEMVQWIKNNRKTK